MLSAPIFSYREFFSPHQKYIVSVYLIYKEFLPSLELCKTLLLNNYLLKRFLGITGVSRNIPADLVIRLFE